MNVATCSAKTEFDQQHCTQINTDQHRSTQTNNDQQQSTQESRCDSGVRTEEDDASPCRPRTLSSASRCSNDSGVRVLETPFRGRASTGVRGQPRSVCWCQAEKRRSHSVSNLPSWRCGATVVTRTDVLLPPRRLRSDEFDSDCVSDASGDYETLRPRLPQTSAPPPLPPRTRLATEPSGGRPASPPQVRRRWTFARFTTVVSKATQTQQATHFRNGSLPDIPTAPQATNQRTSLPSPTLERRTKPSAWSLARTIKRKKSKDRKRSRDITESPVHIRSNTLGEVEIPSTACVQLPGAVEIPATADVVVNDHVQQNEDDDDDETYMSMASVQRQMDHMLTSDYLSMDDIRLTSAGEPKLPAMCLLPAAVECYQNVGCLKNILLNYSAAAADDS